MQIMMMQVNEYYLMFVISRSQDINKNKQKNINFMIP